MINIKYKKQNICIKLKYSKTKSVFSVELDKKKIIKIVLTRKKLFYACLFLTPLLLLTYQLIKSIL